MGVIFSTKIKRICFPYKETSARILTVGLDSAGKSTLVARFKNLVDLQLDTKASYIEDIVTEPTFLYQVETIYPRLAPLALNLWDLGVVFVIDSNDKQRLTLAARELKGLSEKLTSRSSSIPIFIAANKQDLSTSLNIEELNIILSSPKIKSGEWKIFEISAYTGDGVMEMFCCLSQLIHNALY